jgi:hypothetical protein
VSDARHRSGDDGEWTTYRQRLGRSSQGVLLVVMGLQGWMLFHPTDNLGFALLMAGSGVWLGIMMAKLMAYPKATPLPETQA